MSDITFVVEFETDTPAEIKQGLGEALGGMVVGPRINGDGALPTYLLIIQTTMPLLAAAVPSIIDLIRNRKPKRFKLGDVEIENPTLDQWDQVWANYKQSQND